MFPAVLVVGLGHLHLGKVGPVVLALGRRVMARGTDGFVGLRLAQAEEKLAPSAPWRPDAGSAADALYMSCRMLALVHIGELACC